jgi:hypothetical protein
MNNRKTTKQSLHLKDLPIGEGDCEVDHLRLLKNDHSYPDVWYTDGEDKTILSAHYCILKVRYPQLLDGAVKRRKGHFINLAKIKKSISTHVVALEKVFAYVYCGQIDWSSHTVISAVEIVHIALAYGMTHLLEQNKKFIHDQLNIENVFAVLVYANGLGIDDVKKICINFALNNAPVFFTAKEAKILGFELYQEIAGILAEHYNSGKPYPFEEPEVTSIDPIVDNFKSLYQSRHENGDITIVVGDKSCKAHKCILHGHSQLLDEFVLKSEDMKDTAVVELEKYPLVNDEALEEMLQYFYYNNNALELYGVCRMIQFVKAMELNKLMKVLEQIMTDCPMTSKAVPFALEVSFWSQLEQNQQLTSRLRDRSITYAIQHLPEIDFNHLSEMSPITGTVLLQAIQAVIKSYILKGVEPKYNDIVEKSMQSFDDHDQPKRTGSTSKGKRRRKSLKV